MRGVQLSRGGDIPADILRSVSLSDDEADEQTQRTNNARSDERLKQQLWGR